MQYNIKNTKITHNPLQQNYSNHRFVGQCSNAYLNLRLEKIKNVPSESLSENQLEQTTKLNEPIEFFVCPS